MITNLKALLVVLVMAMAVFYIAKPICIQFMAEVDFLRRRNVWFALTATAFISPSFWIYTVVAMPLIYWAGRKDNNPMALYVLLLHVIPPLDVDIPAIFIAYIFELNNYRILAFSILLPVAWRIFQTADKSDSKAYKTLDRFILAYMVVSLIIFIPYDEITNTIRRGFLFGIDSLILVYVTSRTCSDRKKIIEVLSLYITACLIFAIAAVFESQKLWLLYAGLATEWGIPNRGAYLMRGDSLRAQASTGHSLALGYMLAVAFGAWLFLSSYAKSHWVKLLGGLTLWAGLIAALSRAPWLTAVLVTLTYVALNPKGIGKLFKVLAIAMPIAGVILLSPIGASIIDKLPFIGTVDSANVDYRQQLAEMSWLLIQSNPLFGDPLYQNRMESLRQGEGIVDMVNVYASVALLTGIVGLILFVAPMIMGMISSWKISRQSMKTNLELSLLGAVLFACLAGTAFFMATGSFSGALPKIYYLLIGLAAAYGQLQENITNQNAGNNKSERPQFVRYRK